MKRVCKRIISIILCITIVITSIVYYPVNDVNAKTNRDIVVEYMEQMATIKWTAGRNFPTLNGPSGGYKKGVTYRGIPYSQDGGIGEINLEKFKTFNRNNITDDIGRNDCTSSIYYSYKKIGYKGGSFSTGYMIPGNGGFKKVGNYSFIVGDTKGACQKNGKKVMFEAYSKLRPGDALVRRNSSNGHAIMVYSANELSKNKVKIIEHSGAIEHDSTWRVKKDYTFESLYNGGFVPLTIEQLEENSYEISSVEETSVDNDSATIKTLLNQKATVEKVGIFIGTDKNTIKGYDEKTSHSVKAYSLMKTNIGDVKKVTFTKEKLKCNTKYYYKVTVKIGGQWYISSLASFKTKNVAPKKVKNFRMSSETNIGIGDRCTVTWGKPDRATSYDVKVVNSSGKNVQTKTTKTPSFTSQAMKSAGTYTVKVVVVY